MKAYTPLLSRGGVAARQRKSCGATLARADGGGADQEKDFLTSTTPAAAFIEASPYRARASRASAFPSSALEELKIGLNGFNELVLPIFGRHSSPLGGEWRSSSPETGRPAATPLRRGVCDRQLSGAVT